MGELADRLAAAIADVDSAIAAAEANAAATIKTLQARKAALLSAQAFVTPQIEAAVLGLKKIGVDI